MKEITKIGLAVIKDGSILLVKKKELEFLILPGGKPEVGEQDVEALAREIYEEIGCRIYQVEFVGEFTDIAAGTDDTKVTIRLYEGPIYGIPTPQAEIERIVWWEIKDYTANVISNTLKNSILPFLLKRSGAWIYGH